MGRRPSYKVESVTYNFGTCSDEPHLVLRLGSFKFDEGNNSSIDGCNIYPLVVWLYLNKSTFLSLTGKCWDGTKEEIQKIKQDLEARVFRLDFGMKEE